MLRIEESAGWRLIAHRDHARLAGEIACHWGNDAFEPPEPREHILEAVARHDDAWAARDEQPELGPEGKPAAFSHELVGTYSAFEHIDLADYLAVREQATEAVAADNAYAAILVSMHTVNLLTEQANLRALSRPLRALHRASVARQRRRQAELAERLPPTCRGRPGARAFQRGFRFLQACDSLSLIACVRFPRPLPLRHEQPRRDGLPTPLRCTPLGHDTYRISPYPFDQDVLEFDVPARVVPGTRFPELAGFRAAFAAAPVTPLRVTLVR